MLYQIIKKEYDSITERLDKIEEEINKLPPGKLICSHQKKSAKWYLSDGHHKVYIPKSKRQLAEQLARKKYLSLLYQDLSKEQSVLSHYLRHHATASKSSNLLETSSEYQKLLSKYYRPLSDELMNWMNEPYERNKAYPETLIHRSLTSHLLRSKSEVLIDMLLSNHRIPFRYECALSLNGILLYPDFTIRHPKTGDTYYWEHFGLMDNSSYIENFSSKLSLYATNGITPGIRLITTFETKNEPLNPDLIEMYIKYYFE